MWRADANLKVAHEMFEGLHTAYQAYYGDTKNEVEHQVREFIKELKDLGYIVVVSEITYEQVS